MDNKNQSDIPSEISSEPPSEIQPTPEGFTAGYVAISGRPNVGKSTFLNAVLGQKLAIVTSKPQTTRNRIMGVKNSPMSQVVFMDTPGIHEPEHGLGVHMVKEARKVIHDVDVVLYMVEPVRPSEKDKKILNTLKDIGKPVVLGINKIDKIKKNELLPLMGAYSELFPFKKIIPLSALKKDGVQELLDELVSILPEGGRLYPEDMLTDSYERFLIAELIREKVMLITHEEVPHSTAVEIVGWEDGKDIVRISADIIVEKTGQKGIIIGKKGAMLRQIGSTARGDIEKMLDTRIFLKLFVKVKKDWRTKRSILNDLGFR